MSAVASDDKGVDVKKEYRLNRRMILNFVSVFLFIGVLTLHFRLDGSFLFYKKRNI